MHFEIVKFVIWATKRKLPIMLNSAFAQKVGLGWILFILRSRRLTNAGFRIFNIIIYVVLVSALKVLCNLVRIL